MPKPQGPQGPQALMQARFQAEALSRRFCVDRNTVQHGPSRALAHCFPAVARPV